MDYYIRTSVGVQGLRYPPGALSSLTLSIPGSKLIRRFGSSLLSTRAMESVTHLPDTARERPISRAHLKRVLTDLESRDVAGGLTIHAMPGHVSGCVRDLRDSDVPEPEPLRQLAARLDNAESGAVVFWGRSGGVVVLPPFPLERDHVLDGWDPGPLRTLLDTEYLIGVVLLRLGRFAIGVFRGQEMLASKTDARYVKGRHSAGGTSQRRFERVREKQVHELFHKTCTVVKEKFAPFEDKLNYVLLGGEKFTLRAFLKECDYLRGLSPRILGRVLNVREPKHKAVEGVIDTIWESRVLSIE